MATRTDFSGHKGPFSLSPRVSAPAVRTTISFFVTLEFGQSERVVRTSATGIEPTWPNQSFSSRNVQGSSALVDLSCKWSQSTDFSRGIFVDAVMPGEFAAYEGRSQVSADC